VTLARIYYLDADGFVRDLVAELPDEANLATIEALLPKGARFRYAVQA
jgi:hypothetical protein